MCTAGVEVKAMRCVTARIILICLAVAACVKVPPQPPVIAADGSIHYRTSRAAQQIDCDGRPIVLEGDRTEIGLAGPCRIVQITGNHNDITVDIVPAGTIAVTGGHNDVSWRLTVPGPPPVLQDQGESNSFHRMPTER
jgi:hypothetical protein